MKNHHFCQVHLMIPCYPNQRPLLRAVVSFLVSRNAFDNLKIPWKIFFLGKTNDLDPLTTERSMTTHGMTSDFAFIQTTNSTIITTNRSY